MTETPSLHVTDIQQTVEPQIGPDGKMQDIWTITFTTPSGTRGKVVLPASQYTPENVQAQIAHQVAQIEAVHALEGQHLPAPSYG